MSTFFVDGLKSPFPPTRQYVLIPIGHGKVKFIAARMGVGSGTGPATAEQGWASSAVQNSHLMLEIKPLLCWCFWHRASLSATQVLSLGCRLPPRDERMLRATQLATSGGTEVGTSPGGFLRLSSGIRVLGQRLLGFLLLVSGARWGWLDPFLN